MNKYYYECVLDYMKNNDTIDDIEAYNLCGTMRLSGIIHSLRKKGYNIITEKYKKLHDDGKYYVHAKYRLITPEPDRVFTWSELKELLRKKSNSDCDFKTRKAAKWFLSLINNLEN